MSPKTILVTGATRGIGLATVRALVSAGHQLLLHGRNSDLGRSVVASLQAEFPSASVQFLPADLARLEDVRRLAQRCSECAPRLDVLINNAGCAYFSRQTTVDGYEATFAVNHLAPYLLTRLLLPRLSESAPARVVTVASAAHRHCEIDFDDLMSQRDYHAWRTYGRSKLANILFSQELARRTTQLGVSSNSLHPGVINTRLAQNNLFARIIGRLVMPIIGRSVNDGARTSVYLASAPEAEGVTGLYFSGGRPAALNTAPGAVTPAIAARLWDVSAQLVGL